MGAAVQANVAGSELPAASRAKASASNRDAILPSGIFSLFCKDLSPSRTGFSKSKVVLMHQMLSDFSSDVNPETLEHSLEGFINALQEKFLKSVSAG